jgi:TonB family protein
MFIGQRLVGIVVLATSSIVFAQTTETKPPDAGSSGANGGQSSATPAPNPRSTGAKALDQAEILTDTMGVDFGPYLKRVVAIVKQSWYNMMPPSVYPPRSQQGKVAIEFVILKDGRVSNMAVRFSSGDVPLDRAAWASITASTPFPPLPKEFPGQILGLRFYYFYNLKAGESAGTEPRGSDPSAQTGQVLNPELLRLARPSATYLCHFDLTTISISPCFDIRVPAGSTLKFVASGKDITDASVTWSVSGPGCSQSACGTISDAGLYTAPVNAPNPPKVIVKATARSDVSSTSNSEVTVVQANPAH